MEEKSPKYRQREGIQENVVAGKPKGEGGSARLNKIRLTAALKIVGKCPLGLAAWKPLLTLAKVVWVQRWEQRSEEIELKRE